jgi:hemerythrin-like domain-containing protein
LPKAPWRFISQNLQNFNSVRGIADLLDSGQQVDPSILGHLVQFLAIFADHCHHAKEEKYLFPLLATKAGATTKRELQLLEQEHRSAAKLVRELAKASARPTLRTRR